VRHEPSNEVEVQRRATNRARAWRWAKALGGSDLSVWRLELMKAGVARSDATQILLPEMDRRQFSFALSVRSLLAMLAAFAIWLAYLLSHRGGVGQGRWPAEAERVAALHGELSTRTRHVLDALGGAQPPVEAIVLLGRVRRPLSEIAKSWSERVAKHRPCELPLFIPMSPQAVLRTLVDVPGLIKEGLGHAARTTAEVGLREEAAIAFRVFAGTTSAHWWEQHSSACEVVFGITGTADTTLLERAIHRSGGRSIHAVHGQATGPNFTGISDLALFRSLHDARAYERLASYGVCSAQLARASEATRGETGLVLLSNLAHPMNAGFQRFGLRDEEFLLSAVGETARLLGVSAQPLLWKPHPAIEVLPPATRLALRDIAGKQGFEELSPDTNIESVASACRWVVTTPSTVAIELLQVGYLSLVIDPQGSVLDTALAGLPTAACDPRHIVALCRDLELQESYSQAWANAVQAIGPARSLDLRSPLE
jgi:hypothetical protein